MKKAVHFGAGKIGRGLVADLLHDTGYEIIFVDVNEAVNEELNQYHNYYLYVIEEDCRRKEIDHVSALSPAKQPEEVVQAIAEADVITTAVLADNFPKIAGILGRGLKCREKQNAAQINIIPCENAIGNGDLLIRSILETGEIEEEELRKTACVPNTAVDRMVFGTDRDGRDGIEIGKDFELVIERNKLVDPEQEPLAGAEYTSDLNRFLERKLYVINGGHAWAGYMAHLEGFEIIQAYYRNPDHVRQMREVMLEIGALVEQKHGFSHEEMERYVTFAINRFLTPGITDTVARISRAPIRKLGSDDRLVGPAKQLEDLGLPNELLVKGIAAAYLYDQKEDAQSAELMQYVRENGIEAALFHFSGLTAEMALYGKILEQYDRLSGKKPADKTV